MNARRCGDRFFESPSGAGVETSMHPNQKEAYTVEIKAVTNDAEMVVAPVGRLDTNTAPELERELGAMPEEISTLTFDFEKLRYISSAGLRVLLNMQKKFNAKKGKMVIRNANGMIMDVFEATGFLDIFTVEND